MLTNFDCLDGFLVERSLKIRFQLDIDRVSLSKILFRLELDTALLDAFDRNPRHARLPIIAELEKQVLDFLGLESVEKCQLEVDVNSVFGEAEQPRALVLLQEVRLFFFAFFLLRVSGLRL